MSRYLEMARNRDYTETPEVMRLIDETIAARAHAERRDHIVARMDAAEHDPGTEDAWANGCECPRPHYPDADPWELVAWGCPMHDPREAP